MSYRELGGYAPMMNISAGGPGSWFEGSLIGVRTYLDRRNETPRTRYMVTFQCEDVNGVEAQAKTDQGYEDVAVTKGHEYTLSLGTVLERKMASVLKSPERYEGAKFRITFEGLGKVTIKGRKPAKLYKVELDATLDGGDQTLPDDEAEASE